MTSEDFGVSEAVHDGRLYDAINTDLADLPFYERRCRAAAGPVLELCCGTGRLTLPLLRAGIDITGLDFTESMLERGRSKARAGSLPDPFQFGDIRDFDLSRRFALIFLPFNSLQNTYTVDDVLRVFDRVRKHLEPEGAFIFDVFNPSLEFMVRGDGDPVDRHRGVLDDGREVIIAEQCRYDAAGQVNRVTWHHRVGEERFTSTLDMRCYYPLELEALLRLGGWRILERFGDFTEEPFTSASPKQILVCRPIDR